MVRNKQNKLEWEKKSWNAYIISDREVLNIFRKKVEAYVIINHNKHVQLLDKE